MQVAELWWQELGVELAVDEEGLAGERSDAPLVSDDLKGLLDAGLGERIGRGARLAERVAGVPDHVGECHAPRTSTR